jgi:NADPH-dependent 2,4-dienoyl-CoA reductase/sulfur reductase-like enzyme
MNNSPLTIVIVGGVAGGASAATRARRCNETARIVLYEKDQHASFANCGLPYHIGGEIADREKLIVAKPELFRDRFNIELHTRHEVTAIDRARKVVTVLNRDAGTTFEQPYDKLILAPGAAPLVPPIPGVDAPNVFTLRNLEDTDRIQAALAAGNIQRVTVVGAGFIGLEMVEQLHHRGYTISLVEMLPQVLPPLDPEMAHIVQEALTAKGVAVHLGNGLQGLEGDGAIQRVVLSDGTSIDTDAVILGMGVRPSTQLAQAAGLDIGKMGGIVVNPYMQTSDPDIYAAGDAVEYPDTYLGQPLRIPLAGPANRAGRIAGQHAATGSAHPMPWSRPRPSSACSTRPPRPPA